MFYGVHCLGPYNAVVCNLQHPLQTPDASIDALVDGTTHHQSRNGDRQGITKRLDPIVAVVDFPCASRRHAGDVLIRICPPADAEIGFAARVMGIGVVTALDRQDEINDALKGAHVVTFSTITNSPPITLVSMAHCNISMRPSRPKIVLLCSSNRVTRSLRSSNGSLIHTPPG